MYGLQLRELISDPLLYVFNLVPSSLIFALRKLGENLGLWRNPKPDNQNLVMDGTAHDLSRRNKMAAQIDVSLDFAIKQALRKLGFKENFALKEKQYQAIVNIVRLKKDCLVVLPTGYGKSLVYQCLPLVFDSVLRSNTKNAVIIVSPLNSLILDQVTKLMEKGLGATIWKADEAIFID